MGMQVEPVFTAVAELAEAPELKSVTPPSGVDRALVARLVGDAQRDGVAIDGEGGLLAELTRLVLESALDGELTAHLGRTWATTSTNAPMTAIRMRAMGPGRRRC